MDVLLQMGGYVVSVLAAAGIVIGIEALNERCPYASPGAASAIPVPVAERTDPRGRPLQRKGP
jgi:hypothetical protein